MQVNKQLQGVCSSQVTERLSLCAVALRQEHTKEGGKMVDFAGCPGMVDFPFLVTALRRGPAVMAGKVLFNPCLRRKGTNRSPSDEKSCCSLRLASLCISCFEVCIWFAASHSPKYSGRLRAPSQRRLRYASAVRSERKQARTQHHRFDEMDSKLGRQLLRDASL